MDSLSLQIWLAALTIMVAPPLLKAIAGNARVQSLIHRASRGVRSLRLSVLSRSTDAPASSRSIIWLLVASFLLGMLAPRLIDIKLPDINWPVRILPIAGGPRHILIVHEATDEATAAIGRQFTALRVGPHADYLKSKNHVLTILDDDNPSSLLQKWKGEAQKHTSPSLLILSQDGNKLIHAASLPPDADATMAVIKAYE